MNELDIIRMIQSIHNEFFDTLFQYITMLGESSIILMIILCLYWGYNKKLGEYVAYSYFTSCLMNNWIKNIFKADRPIGKEGIRSLRTQTATGYSFPSGHTQGAASSYFAIATFKNKQWFKWGSLLLIILVGISRLYLGVHYPRDVIAGLILGVLIASITYNVYQKVENKQLLYLTTLLIFIPGILISSVDFSKSLGAFIGFALGTAVEKKYDGFNQESQKSVKLIRCVFGIIIVLLVKNGLNFVLGNFSYNKFIIYSLLSFIGFGLYPVALKTLLK